MGGRGNYLGKGGRGVQLGKGIVLIAFWGEGRGEQAQKKLFSIFGGRDNHPPLLAAPRTKTLRLSDEGHFSDWP